LSRETIGIGVSALFELPQLVCPPGTADHWPLSQREEKTLVERVEAVIDMLPKRVKTRGVSFAAKVMPPLALVVTAILMTKPRIDITRELIANQKRAPRAPAGSSHERTVPTNGTGDANASGIVGSITPDAAVIASYAAAHSGATNNAAGSGVGAVEHGVTGNGNSGAATRHNVALSDEAFRC
jgi:hypothetical protein